VRTLVLATETPIPPTSGLRVRTLHLTRQLAAVADVDVAALGDAPSVPGEPFRLHGVGRGRGRLAAALAAIRRPYLAAKLDSRELASFASRGGWDTVQAEFPFTVPAALHAGVPVVLDAHNVETDVVLGFLGQAPHLAARLRWTVEQRRTERFERWAVASAQAVCATSSEDAERLTSLGARRVEIVPNGVETSALAFADPSDEPRLLYVGHYGYRPNAAAARELVREVLPRVRQRIPAATVTLVGGDPPQDLGGEAVVAAGAVPSVVPYLHRSRALVVPLRAGSGTRLKVLEALAAGLPVVSTPLGVAGLDVRDGEEVLLGETADDLASQAARVLEDRSLAVFLARNGRALAERRYDWGVVAQPLLALHEELART
jgi:glycosyltransferase involved in cell wall biosynthesis